MICSDEEETKIYGRPSINVDKVEIIHLRALNFSWTKISKILGVCRQTVYRQLEEFYTPSYDYTDISSSELDVFITDIKKDHPNDDEVMM